MRKTLLLLLLLLPLATAEEFIFDHTLYSAQEITVDVVISNRISIAGTANKLEARLEYFPKNHFGGQTILQTHNSPEPVREQDALLYSWTGQSTQAVFSHSARVKSEYWRPEIRAPSRLPYRHLPPELMQYLNSEAIIRITPEIAAQAAEIVGDEDDAVKVAFLLGKWVKENIEYSLTTVTTQASMPSDWVLENRYGVCDELTSLFIAMLRSQGIPARFISGVAYTNLEILDTPWGPHGWAEVWFPGVGWVPYDVTYGQYGYVDATHIAFQASPDAAQNAATYSMVSSGAHFQPAELQRTVTLRDRAEDLVPPYELAVSVAVEEVGPLGYTRVDATITNNADTYAAEELHLVRTQGTTTNEQSKSILLGPKETRTVHWLVRVEQDLRSGYRYTFPIAVHTSSGARAETLFHATSTAVSAPAESLAIEEDAPKRALPGQFACQGPSRVRADEEFTVTCSFSEQARLCISECDYNAVNETMSFSELGVHTFFVTATRGERSQRHVISIAVVDAPRANLTVNVQRELLAADTGTLQVRLEKNSLSAPTDVVVTVKHALWQQQWTVQDLSRPAVMDLQLQGLQLHSGDNTVRVTATWHDGDEERLIEQTVRIKAVPTTFGERLTLWINKALSWLSF
jgi:transglutaminase-like putative cysteine protease